MKDCLHSEHFCFEHIQLLSSSLQSVCHLLYWSHLHIIWDRGSCESYNISCWFWVLSDSCSRCIIIIHHLYIRQFWTAWSKVQSIWNTENIYKVVSESVMKLCNVQIWICEFIDSISCFANDDWYHSHLLSSFFYMCKT